MWLEIVKQRTMQWFPVPGEDSSYPEGSTDHHNASHQDWKFTHSACCISVLELAGKTQWSRALDGTMLYSHGKEAEQDQVRERVSVSQGQEVSPGSPCWATGLRTPLQWKESMWGQINGAGGLLKGARKGQGLTEATFSIGSQQVWMSHGSKTNIHWCPGDRGKRGMIGIGHINWQFLHGEYQNYGNSRERHQLWTWELSSEKWIGGRQIKEGMARVGECTELWKGKFLSSHLHLLCWAWGGRCGEGATLWTEVSQHRRLDPSLSHSTN